MYGMAGRTDAGTLGDGSPRQRVEPRRLGARRNRAVYFGSRSAKETSSASRTGFGVRAIIWSDTRLLGKRLRGSLPLEDELRHKPTMRCIYCFREQVALSEEHIIPEGLGGNQVIPSASCAACRDKTSRIELRVLRHSHGLRVFRSKFGIGKRRRGEKLSRASIAIGAEERERVVEVPLEDHPVPLALPLFEPPTELTAAPTPKGVRVRGYHCFASGATSQEVLRKVDEKEARLRTRQYDHAFARLLAKVAHCAWVSEYGLASLSEATAPGILNGSFEAVGRFVGSLDYALRGDPHALCLHSIHLSVNSTFEPRLACARVQFFVQLVPSPTYVVVVGRLPRHARVDPAMQQWQLPRKGMIGTPLPAPLPRWVGTTLFGRREHGDGVDILAELEGIGLWGSGK